MAEEFKTYEEYGYDNKMMKSNQGGKTTFAADTSISMAGFDAGVLTGGEIKGDLVITYGRIVVKDGERDMLTIDRSGLTLFDESGTARAIIGDIQ